MPLDAFIADLHARTMLLRRELGEARRRLNVERATLRSLRQARVTAQALERVKERAGEAEEVVVALHVELGDAESALRQAQEERTAERERKIAQHLERTYLEQRRLLETSGKVAVFMGTRPEDWAPTNGTCEISWRDLPVPRSDAEHALDEWLNEPTFVSTFPMGGEAPKTARRSPGPGAIWTLDFDEIYREDWG